MAHVDVNDLLTIQSETYSIFSKARANFKKTPKERMTVEYIEGRLESLEKYWSKFDTVHLQIVCHADQDIKKSHSYFTEDLHETVEELYYSYKGELKTKLKSLTPVTPSTSNQQTMVEKSSATEVKLPRITIPVFSGNYTEWQSFYDLFMALIHKNERLEDVQKLHYLKSNLSGEAEALLKAIPITGSNYSEAWKILKKRYDNKRYIANCIFQRFFGQRSITHESSQSIKLLLDTSVECLKALKNLDLPTEHWDAIIVYILKSKLDSVTLKEWEEAISGETADELPTFESFQSFLETKFRTLEMVESNKGGRPTKSKSFHVTLDVKCAFCNDSHYIYHCKSFAKLSVEDRFKFVQNNGLCFNCMVPNHSVFKCRQPTNCKICHKKYHSLLHLDRKQVLNDKSSVEESSSHKDQEGKESRVMTHFSKGEHSQPGQNVLLATALVDVTSSIGLSHVFRALIDQGSQASFVTERLVQLLGLKKTRVNGVVSSIGEGENKLCIKYMVEFKVQSRYKTTFITQVRAYVLSSLTSSLPSKEIVGCDWPELNHLTLADPDFSTPSRIDILLGADIFSEIVDVGLVKGPDGIVAQCTQLGWILSGNRKNTNTTGQKDIVSMHVTIDNDILKRFWEIETNLYNTKKKYTQEEESCEEIYKATTTRDITGRYTVNLPLKYDLERTLRLCGNTKEIAIARFKQLEKRFERNQKLKQEYAKVIEEYKQLGHMCRIEENERSIYLPHHAVIREDKDTTKVRVVYNASQKGSNGNSLNDCLLIGPTIQPDLRSLITLWRTHKICIIGDIVKMYRQVRVINKHAELQRIVWRDEPNQAIEHYRLQTVTFGTASAPYLAVRTLSQLADDEFENFPGAAKIIKTSFYMDDLMSGSGDVQQAETMCHEINELLHAGGFQMQKWSSNSEELLNLIQKDSEIVPDNLNIKLDPIIKILGLVWDRHDDKFKFTVHLKTLTYPITKRVILSDIARLFDPFGWLAPVIITAKIFIQRLWLCNAGWDDELPSETVKEWLVYREDLNNLKEISIPRWLKTNTNDQDVQIHGFSDASTAAYSAVAYLRVVEGEDVWVSIIAARTKVAPLKQLSVPRLELCGAVLLAKLLKDLMELLNINKDRVFAWTDSMVVLAWLQSPPAKWQTFVGNRVSEIMQLIDNDKWRHVQSSDNPADPASRGLKVLELKYTNKWWTGPEWLKEKQTKYVNKEIPETDLEERKKPTAIFGLYTEIEEKPIWERFSHLTKMKRVLAYCLRLGKQKIKQNYLTTSSEMETILTRCIQYYQNQAFNTEIAQLKKEGKVKKRSKLATLAPFLDENGTLLVGGRLQKAELPYETVHSIIIPGKDHITKLLVNEAHIKTLHGGNQLMMAFLRSKYWIFGLKNAIKACIRSCVICVRHRAQISQQIMGQLPSVRVNPGRAFLTTGVDYAGPVQIKMSKGRGNKSYKGYICLFICMCTKAVHLEAVTDLTSEAFIAAFRRFVARRGHCAKLWSDNGTNFVGAAKELRIMFDQAKSKVVKEISEILSNDGTEWQFIPPKAPNFGGLWEAGIKSTKKHLVRVIGSTMLTYEEMSTLLTQIEACLNSRPLCRLNTDDVTPLTPGHFLIGEPLIGVPSVKLEDNVSLVNRWHLIQKMTQHFWKRWQTEYLHQMQQRHKWQFPAESPNIGDVVIIKDEGLPPTKWPLGRITEIHVGPDQRVRVVTLRWKGDSVMKRPLSKVVRLPIQEN